MAVQDLWERADGSPSARYGRGRRYRVVVAGHPSRSFAAKRPAVAWEAKLLNEEPRTPVSVESVDVLVDRWLLGKKGLSKKGYEGARIAAAHVRERWRGVLPGDVFADDVQAWIAGLPPSSARKASQALGGAMRGAIARGMVVEDVSRGVSLPPEERRDGRPFTVGQVRKVAEHARLGKHDWGPLVWLLAATGVRPAEAIAADVGDVDVKRRRLRVRKSKTRKARDVPVPASVLAMLDLERPATAPLFVGVRGHRLNLHWWRGAVFNPAMRAAKVRDRRLYDLRHSAVSLAIAAGADVKVVQRMVGHTSAKLTLDVYGHLFDDALDAVADRMEGLLGQVGTTGVVPGACG